ncbi:unnamed protein product [Lactuca virosa]|uniref:Uncharacterized protein n=1 Tax=Lactuca virosa TaxID=75947 RepID=A0AAU9N7T0_9ASTR|nr:unnamed protein product [Lactuca virosa]
MAGVGSWSASSLLEEEHVVLGASNPIDTAMMIMTSGEESTDYVDDTEPDYTLVEQPSEPAHSPDYTSAELELLSSEYNSDEDDDTASSPVISPTRTTPSHRSSRAHTGGGYRLTFRGMGVRFYTSRTPYTPVEQVVSLLVPCTTHHSDRIGAMDSELFLLRMAMRQLTEQVQYFEEERDVMDMRTLLIRYQLQEARDEAQFHHQVLEEVMSHTERLELQVERTESRVSFFDVWIEYVYRQLVQLMSLFIVYYGF